MIKLENIQISYDSILIDHGNMTVNDGSITAIVGKSGAGKTTLLNHLAFLSQGWFYHMDYYLDGDLLKYKTERQVNEIYRKNYFYLFQDSNMLDELTCRDNLLFLCDMYKRKADQKEIDRLIQELDIDFDLEQYPNTISGGQKQKLELMIVALIQPRIILCDEITSSLDQETAVDLFEKLIQIVHRINGTCIVVTHDVLIMNMCDQIYKIENKQLIEIKESKNDGLIQKQNSAINHSLGWNFMKYKLHNRQFLKQTISVSFLLVILISFFSLLWSYNIDIREQTQNTFVSTMNCEFIFSDTLITDLGTPYYTCSTVLKDSNTKVNVHVGEISKEIEKHLIKSFDKEQGVYINESLYQQIDGNIVEFTINDHVYKEQIKGVVDHTYHLDEYENEIYLYSDEQLDLGYTKRLFYSEDLSVLTKLQKQLEGFNVEIFGEYRDFSSISNEKENLADFLDLLLYITGIILITFVMIYGLMRKHQKKQESNLLYKRGVKSFELFVMQIYENFPMNLLVLVFSILISVILQLYLTKTEVFIHSHINMSLIINAMLIFFIDIVMQMIISLMNR